jgi:hypothetical protein
MTEKGMQVFFEVHSGLSRGDRTGKNRTLTQALIIAIPSDDVHGFRFQLPFRCQCCLQKGADCRILHPTTH